MTQQITHPQIYSSKSTNTYKQTPDCWMKWFL